MSGRTGFSIVLVVLLAMGALTLGGCGLGIMKSGRPAPGDPVLEGLDDAPAPAADSDIAMSKAEEVDIFKNLNDGAVRAGSTVPVTFTLEKQTRVSYIQTYHWDSGKEPGEISLEGEDGTVYGPWKAVGTEGQGGMPNAYWEVRPDESLKPGTYTVIDSDPGSWSTNDEMGGRGQTIVRGFAEE